MKAEKKVTISDIARESGASIATVSRVLNNVDYPVSQQLRERILNITRSLEYTTRGTAVGLRRNAAKDIAVLIPNITNPFYSQAILGIESIIQEKGYNILLYNTFRSKKRERECLEMLLKRHVRGVIISTMEGDANDLLQLTSNGIQFLLLDQVVPGLNCPSIYFDSCRGAKLAMEYLFQNGHRRIAFATTPMVRSTRIDTHSGYSEALASAGVQYRPDYVFQAQEESEEEASQNYELEAGHSTARQFLESGCDATAILCVNDMLAIGIINTLTQAGLRIPGDVSVVGFDDIPFAGVYQPQLTTVHYPIYETGKLAAMLLLDNITNDGHSQIAFSMNLEPSIVARQTVRDISV